MPARLALALVGLHAALAACSSSSSTRSESSDQNQPVLKEQPLVKDGLRITYGVDLDMMVDTKVLELAAELRRQLGTHVDVVTTPITGALELRLQDPSKRAEVMSQLTRDAASVLEPHECQRAPHPATVCARLGARSMEAARLAGLEQIVRAIRLRFEASNVIGHVSASKDNVIVDLPPGDPEVIHRTRDLIARTARLELAIADHDTQYMKRLFAKVASDPAAAAAAITGDVDRWTNADSHFTDYYLRAPDREQQLSAEDARRIGCVRYATAPPGDPRIRCSVSGQQAIRRYLDELAIADPHFSLPDDHRLVFERIAPQDRALEPYWRSHYVARAMTITSASVKRARRELDPNTRRPIVIVTFDTRGTKALAELTAANVGKKLATIIDERVASAPIIVDPLRRGEISITLSDSDDARIQRDASELAMALSFALPTRLREETVSELVNGVPRPPPSDP